MIHHRFDTSQSSSQPKMKQWFALAFSINVVRRATIMSLFVAPVLILINQGDAMLDSSQVEFSWIKAILTFAVPYAVSTIASVSTLRVKDL